MVRMITSWILALKDKIMLRNLIFTNLPPLRLFSSPRDLSKDISPFLLSPCY